jgi:3',5'-nucleoside bisphosphate phosphatase
MAADLHIHSVFSDGSMKPEEIVKLAAENNIFTIALTDHDTVEGIEYARVAGLKYNVEIIPGIELSSFRNETEIHILGYFIDDKNEVFLKELSNIFHSRINRAKKMIKLLNKQGINITFADLRKTAGNNYIGRPHIAKAMLEKGYINKMGEAFSNNYIGNGGKAYVPKYKISPEEAIDMILKANGIPVLAHPAFINHGKSINKVDIEKLYHSGLMGIEVYQTKHSQKDVEYYRKIAEDLNLLITGGSDYHGENSPDIKIGDIKLDDSNVIKLKEKWCHMAKMR